ncbi:tryptophan-rich sensory protein [Breoghania sp.]|uniref:tryptophan-rich sensory protein n=1 Tax=Breoghania sp. TaxID=2065378 RepID=UPI00261558DD|nr:tryptophan-rich sensory protein [Breoghania sp.]MDJ0930358.1 tryptophan-rich sensory protein [Breoghania sp.]
MFFLFQDPYRALVLIVLLLILYLWFPKETWNRDKIASRLFAVYTVWIVYVTYLNAMIWYLNRVPDQAPVLGH